MKALIWILSLFVFIVLNTILGAATGFRAGSVCFTLFGFTAHGQCAPLGIRAESLKTRKRQECAHLNI